MTDPGSVMTKLDDLALELDTRSKELAETERQLGTEMNRTTGEILPGVEARYEEALGDWEAGLWDECQMSDTKWPPEKLRQRMGHRAMDASLLGSFNALTAKRKRLEKRIGSIKVQVDAQRSILSALKEEMAASR